MPNGSLEAALRAVSAERIAARISELAQIGALPGGGVGRLGYTIEEECARKQVAGWLKPLGYDEQRDIACNLFCASGDRPRILMGSHLDSVPQGGRYDGALGVVAAVEAAQAAAEAGLRLPLEIVAWADEEGARFGTGLFGSGMAFDRLPAHAWDRRDREGISVRDAAAALLERAPLAGEGRPRMSGVRAYLELHIEQGPRLEELGQPVGIVDHIVGLTHGNVQVFGRADHAGTTPMPGRQDALAAAAECILAVERAARESASIVATVGEIAVTPAAKNVIPGVCRFSLDIRSRSDDARRGAVQQVRAAVDAICHRRGVRAEIDLFNQVPAAAMASTVIGVLERACADLGLPAMHLDSGAGHDAQNAAAAGVPTGMIFVRSSGGSHNPAEHASSLDAVQGTRVLLAAAAALARGKT